MMTDGCVFIGGDYVVPSEAKMSIFDTGFVWSDVVYDVTSTWKGWFFMLDEHLDRFARSCDGFRLENPYGADDMRQILAECVARTGLENTYVKIQLTRGVIQSQTRDPRLGDPQFVAYATPYAWIWGEEKCRNGASLYLSGIERISSKAVDARYKNYNRADLVQSRFEAYDHDCDDSILVGADGAVTEGPGYNIFLVKDGAVITPDANVLEGITRRAVNEICDEEGIPFAYRKIDPAELGEADELFASTTAGGVMPVIRLGDKPIGNAHPGLVTSRVQSRYWQKRAEGWHGTRVEDIRAAA
jgi:branched-chain amino acid aminotransferase